MKKINIIFTMFLLLVFSYSTVFAARYKGDMNNDNNIDILDVRLLLQEYINNGREKDFRRIKSSRYE